MAQGSGEGEDGKEGQRLHEEEGCLPWVLALVVWMVLVESVDEVAGEETAGGSDNVMG